MIERTVNEYGQKQIINNLDKIVKIGDRYLQVRLIKTKKWKEKDFANGDFTEPMPRAKFVYPDKDKKIHYMVERDYLIKLKKNVKKKKE